NSIPGNSRAPACSHVRGEVWLRSCFRYIKQAGLSRMAATRRSPIRLGRPHADLLRPACALYRETPRPIHSANAEGVSCEPGFAARGCGCVLRFAVDRTAADPDRHRALAVPAATGVARGARASAAMARTWSVECAGAGACQFS